MIEEVYLERKFDVFHSYIPFQHTQKSVLLRVAVKTTTMNFAEVKKKEEKDL